MFRLLLLFALCVKCLTAPLPDDRYELIPERTTDPVVVELERQLSAVSYIQNFKNVLAEYVLSQYQNLTIRETEQVKQTLEDFLTGFAKDLKDAILRQEKNEKADIGKDVIADGIPDETFAEVKERVRESFPDVTEDTANEIIYKLRKNLFETRQKLDVIIRDSQRAQYEIENN